MQADYSSLRVGLVGLGLEAYWNQFYGLKQGIRGYLATVEERIARPERQIVNLGLVDSPRRSGMLHTAAAKKKSVFCCLGETIHVQDQARYQHDCR